MPMRHPPRAVAGRGLGRRAAQKHRDLAPRRMPRIPLWCDRLPASSRIRRTYRTDDCKNLRDQKIRSKLRGSVHWRTAGRWT
ncbi:hypothetical protein GGR77_003051 [Xanthomonas translucens]